MSDGGEPTLRGVILGLKRVQNELTSVRTVLLDRMDRLRNTMAAMPEEQIILNGLVVANQKTAERGLGEARFAVDQTSTLAQTIGSLQIQIRQLRADVDEIRDRPRR